MRIFTTQVARHVDTAVWYHGTFDHQLYLLTQGKRGINSMEIRRARRLLSWCLGDLALGTQRHPTDTHQDTWTGGVRCIAGALQTQNVEGGGGERDERASCFAGNLPLTVFYTSSPSSLSVTVAMTLYDVFPKHEQQHKTSTFDREVGTYLIKVTTLTSTNFFSWDLNLHGISTMVSGVDAPTWPSSFLIVVRQ